jgi:hypothetical protein
VTTTYLSSIVIAALDCAQSEINQHVATSRAGRCLTCGEVEPCRARLGATAVFARFGRLPHRIPGLAGAVWTVDAMIDGARLRTPVPHRREECFYRAMHYTAGAAWALGVADEAMATMREIVERALRQRDANTDGAETEPLSHRR